jgi:ferredoxin-NADP reductase
VFEEITRMSTEWELEVTAREVVAEGVVRLTLSRPDRSPLPEWEPGAHLDLHLDAELVRQYSLCGDLCDREAYQVAVLREPAGRGGSAHVHDRVRVGSVLPVGGPRNNFVLRDAERYLFLAGGIGITPIRPMVAAAEKAGADWRLVYGGRTAASMAFTAELAERYGDRVEIVHGLLDLDALLGSPEADTLVYCCGPEPLLVAVESQCAVWPTGALHVERFAPKEFDEPVRTESFQVELAQSGMTLDVPPDRSILEVVEAAGVQVLSSCQEGTCGTCETGVLAGEPEHRDSLLTNEERAANDTMMICVSRSCGAKLVLDL